MFALREYARAPRRLADFLPWAALVAPGVVLNKDGSFQRSARFRGPDLDSAMPSELAAAAHRLNNALRRLGSGWAVFVEARRDPAADYPDSRFPELRRCLASPSRPALGRRSAARRRPPVPLHPPGADTMIRRPSRFAPLLAVVQLTVPLGLGGIAAFPAPATAQVAVHDPANYAQNLLQAAPAGDADRLSTPWALIMIEGPEGGHVIDDNVPASQALDIVVAGGDGREATPACVGALFCSVGREGGHDRSCSKTTGRIAFPIKAAQVISRDINSQDRADADH